MSRKLANAAKVRVLIDGICLQTTAGNLRTGAISISLRVAWREFEEYHDTQGTTGRLARFHDHHLNRNVDIQFDLY